MGVRAAKFIGAVQAIGRPQQVTRGNVGGAATYYQVEGGAVNKGYVAAVNCGVVISVAMKVRIRRVKVIPIVYRFKRSYCQVGSVTQVTWAAGFVHVHGQLAWVSVDRPVEGRGVD